MSDEVLDVTEMLMRDYFAAQALPAIITDAMRHNAACRHPNNLIEFDEMATKAYVVADQMIKQRGL